MEKARTFLLQLQQHIDCGGSLNVVMQKQNILYSKASFGVGRNPDRQLDCRIPCVAPSMLPCRGNEKSCLMKAKFPSITKHAGLNFPKNNDGWRPGRIKAVVDENPGELSDEDDDLCPVDCVREFKTDEEFLRILEKAKETDSLVVVDFYRTSCGSCKYIEQGFAKLCKGSGDQEAAVTFLKHNVSISVSLICPDCTTHIISKYCSRTVHEKHINVWELVTIINLI
ncbi:hypothetical protein H0E87_023937 [Populus deltoides]|uniref:Thioredoxin domain-containing protein n=1 Tax=Populus deltoides TaxID=3696 RepID=A0A8T2X7R5_POPDE|nr:hypothetical protein H0E87_023937 [Populus deltoides]